MDTKAESDAHDLFAESLPVSGSQEPTQVAGDAGTDDADSEGLFGETLPVDPSASATLVATQVATDVATDTVPEDAEAVLDDLFGASPSAANVAPTQVASNEVAAEADLDDLFGESAGPDNASATQVAASEGDDEAVLDDLFAESAVAETAPSATQVILQSPTHDATEDQSLKAENQSIKADDTEVDDLFGDSVVGDPEPSATQAATEDDLDDLFGDSVAEDPSGEATQLTKEVNAEAADFAALFGDDEVASDDGAAGPQPEISDIFAADIDDDEEDIRRAGKKKSFVKEELPSKVKEELGAEGEGGTGDVGDDNEAAKPAIDPEEEERDLFGELSDVESEGGREIEEHSVRKRLLPDGEVFLFKIPNTLAMQMEPYNPDNLESSIGFKERLNAYDRPAVALCGPENTIRWRFKCDERGERMRDDNGDAVFESNSQFVEFEDGSIMLQVGDEYFECQNRAETRSHLYVEEENDLFVFHKPLTRQMQVVPSAFTSKTHERLLNSQINKVRSSRTVKPLSQMQAEKKSREQEAEAEEMRQRQVKKTLPKKRPVMDADYLEGDETAEGPSLKVLKKNPALGGFLERAAQTLG